MNEGWAIKTHQTLNEVRDNAIHVLASPIKHENYGKLIHATHKVHVDNPLVDSTFGISRHAVSLTRSVEMYQWVEHSTSHDRKLDNGEIETTTKYTYSKDWKSSVQNTGSFKKPDGHQNPSQMPYSQESQSASAVNFGDFELSESLVSQLTSSSAVPLSQKDLPSELQKVAKVTGRHISVPGDWVEEKTLNGDGIERHIETIDGNEKIIYEVKSTGERFSSKHKAEDALKKNKSGPRGGVKVGDVRVSFTEVPCRTVSILAKQSDSTLTQWDSSLPGYTYGIVTEGSRSVDEMVSSAQSDNETWCWIKRIGGFVLTWVAYSMMTGLLHTLVDWVPLVRNLVSLGLTIMNGTLAVSTTLVVVSVGWIFYRPMIGCSLLAVGLGALYIASQAGSKKNPTTVETVKKE
eukprot:TRINITY_DN2281_c0_g1_i2.p1 TRINITY_DN2281_c0_g1~~TRINITY_DN2281_c0_g1_i2.p1  ORF type:complete len:405 (-),score=95.81 TRINITY_DN2281_c0_g1_i2:253-1467(-)